MPCTYSRFPSSVDVTPNGWVSDFGKLPKNRIFEKAVPETTFRRPVNLPEA